MLNIQRGHKINSTRLLLITKVDTMWWYTYTHEYIEYRWIICNFPTLREATNISQWIFLFHSIQPLQHNVYSDHTRSTNINNKKMLLGKDLTDIKFSNWCNRELYKVKMNIFSKFCTIFTILGSLKRDRRIKAHLRVNLKVCRIDWAYQNHTGRSLMGERLKGYVVVTNQSIIWQTWDSISHVFNSSCYSFELRKYCFFVWFAGVVWW